MKHGDPMSHVPLGVGVSVQLSPRGVSNITPPRRRPLFGLYKLKPSRDRLQAVFEGVGSRRVE